MAGLRLEEGEGFSLTSSKTGQDMRWTKIRVRGSCTLTPANASWTNPMQPQRTSTGAWACTDDQQRLCHRRANTQYEAWTVVALG